MFASALLYAGVLVAAAGVVLLLRKRTRKRALLAAAAGLVLIIVAAALPAPDIRAWSAATHLDRIVPVWQFSEHHAIAVAAPPERVFKAIRAVRADEIALFRFLTWLRRGGRKLPENILNAGTDRPILDIATSSGFVWLADDPPRELVVGTVVVAPPGTKGKLTPEVFHRPLPPGFALAVMNFLVMPDDRGGSIVTTETRVYANDDHSRRAFARYWRVIYPGSALIRRMWLRAIERRAEA
jgi:hypothetical protein